MIYFIKIIFRKIIKSFIYLFFVVPEIIKAKINKGSNNIKQIIDGDCFFGDGNYAVFLIFQKNDISWNVRNALTALHGQGVNVVIVSNGVLNEAQLSYLKGVSNLILIRENVGYDFGGYKEGTLYLKNKKISINKLIYLNDSTYFYKKGLDDLFIGLLNSEYSAVTAYENWEFYYHLQSFCLSINSEVWESKKFEDFWINYLPVSSRLWAIKYGEVGFSKMLLSVAKNINVIYKAADLKKKIINRSFDELIDAKNFLPKRVRMNFAELDGDSNIKLVIDELMERGAAYSQIHTLGFYHIKYNKSPLLKKDLVYRMQLSPREFEDNLIEAGCLESIESVLMDIRRKGVGENLTGWKKVKWRFGIE